MRACPSLARTPISVDKRLREPLGGLISVDSACTAHITFDRSLFATYEPLDSASVEMGTKASAKVTGRGDVHLRLSVDGRIEPCKLTDVLHVPDFAFSLLSVSRLTEVGMNVGFVNGKCTVKRGATLVATATLVGELYVLDIVNDIGSAHAATLQTWHERFAHVHSQRIASMIRDNVVSGVKLLGNEANIINSTNNDCISEKCSACVYRKATRSVIPKERSSRRAYFCLNLVHSDVCGPLELQSIGGAKYFITFIDDHSNLSVVFTLCIINRKLLNDTKCLPNLLRLILVARSKCFALIEVVSTCPRSLSHF